MPWLYRSVDLLLLQIKRLLPPEAVQLRLLLLQLLDGFHTVPGFHGLGLVVVIIIGDLLRQGLIILFPQVNAVLPCQKLQRWAEILHGSLVLADFLQPSFDNILNPLVVLRIFHQLISAHAGRIALLCLLLAVLLLRGSGDLLLGLLLRLCLAHGLRGRFPKLIRPVFADFIFRHTQLF